MNCEGALVLFHSGYTGWHFFGNGEWCKSAGPAGEPHQVWLSAGETLADRQAGTEELEGQVRAEGCSRGSSGHAKGQAHPEAQ